MSDLGPERQGRPRTLGDVRLATAMAVAGFAAVAIGSLGPWVTTVLGSAEGTRGDGKITLVAAGVGALALLLDRGSGTGVFFAGVAALAAAGTSGYDIVHIERRTAEVSLFGHRLATAGWGVYVVFAGALVAMAAIVLDAPAVPRATVWVVAVVGGLAVIVAGPIRSSATRNANAGRSVPAVSSIATVPTIPTITNPVTSTDATYSDSTTSYGATTPNGTTSSSGGLPSSATTACDQNVSAGIETSCPFAENVFKAVAHGYQRGSTVPSQVTASSPVTHKTYSLSCSSDGNGLVTCTSSTGSLVTFSESAVQAYDGLETATTGQ